MRLRLTAALLVLLLLTSCSGVSLRVDELHSPPRLTAEQSAIYDAIETAVGTDSFKLKYPRRGDYLSACVLTDLDRDGTDEAIAFYELTVNGVTSAWMSILVQKDGIWKSRQELPGEGAEIDFIDFAPVDRADHNNIIVGWIVAGQESMLCKVYDYDETVSLQYEGNYNECLIQDVDRNGLSEIVLCTVGGSRTPVMSLVKYRSGRIVRTSEVQMPSSMTGYAQLVCGQLTSGLTAICADLYLGNDEMTTRIAALDTQKSIIEELPGEELGIYESFDRPTPTLYCRDINQDGQIDLPVVRRMPGYEKSNARDALYLTQYKSIIDGSLETVASMAVNFSNGYRFILPESWVNAVTVRRQSDTGEWRFVLYREDLDRSVTELLRIRVTSPSDYQDKFETAEYRTVATKGVNSYEIHIPDGNYPGYSISYEQAENLFALLD